MTAPVIVDRCSSILLRHAHPPHDAYAHFYRGAVLPPPPSSASSLPRPRALDALASCLPAVLVRGAVLLPRGTPLCTTCVECVACAVTPELDRCYTYSLRGRNPPVRLDPCDTVVLASCFDPSQVFPYEAFHAPVRLLFSPEHEAQAHQQVMASMEAQLARSVCKEMRAASQGRTGHAFACEILTLRSVRHVRACTDYACALAL